MTAISRLLRTTFIAGLYAAQFGCSSSGGDGGISGSGNMTGSRVMAVGTIDGFGSIYVNDVRYDLEGAEIRTEDGTDERALKLGMVVTVRGERVDARTATADSVVYDSALIGPVESITGDPGKDDTLTLAVLGVQVRLDVTSTLFEDTGFDTIAVNDVIDVSGHVDADGTLHATRVAKTCELQLGVTDVELAGMITGLAGDNFNIGPIGVITHAGTQLPHGEPADGQGVDVEGVLQSATQILANRISSTATVLPDGEAELQGIVTSLTSTARFTVAGIEVDASAAQFIPSTFAETIASGALVEVEGEVVNGVVQAARVKRRSASVRLWAPVDSVDTDAGTITLNFAPAANITVTTGALTSFRDQRDRLDGFNLVHIESGDLLRLGGASDDTLIFVSEVRRVRNMNHVRLRGPAEMLDFLPPDSGNLSVFGVTVRTGAGTNFTLDGAAVDAATFFADPRVGGAGADLDIKDNRQSNAGDGIAEEVGLGG